MLRKHFCSSNFPAETNFLSMCCRIFETERSALNIEDLVSCMICPWPNIDKNVIEITKLRVIN